jgi:hypothetical protein
MAVITNTPRAQTSNRRATAVAPDDKGIDFAAGWCTTGPVSGERSAANCKKCGQPAMGTMRQKGRAPGLGRLQKAGREAPLRSAHGGNGAYFVAASYISPTWSQLMRLSKNALR